jgi:hypothetical protein
MSTSEKQEPSADTKPEETDRIWHHIPCLVFSICCSALGYTSLTRINCNDSFLEGAMKLLPGFGAAILIQAAILHAALLRAIWNGRFPDERMSSCQRLAWHYYCCSFTLQYWRHIVGFHISAICAFFANRSLWSALRCAREVAERKRSSRAESAAEKGHTLTSESTADNIQSPMPLRFTTLYMLGCSFVVFVDLGVAIYSEKIDMALSFFGPCFLAALMVAALALHSALSLPRVLHGSHGRDLIFAYRCGGLYVLPCTCLALGFAMWYHKGRPLYPGVYAAGYWASALYMGVGEVLEQSLLSS